MTLADGTVAEAWRVTVAAVDWWLAELGALLPADVRRYLGRGPALTAEARPGGFRLARRGAEVAASPRGQKVTLLLPRDRLLIREVPAAALPEADLRRMLTLDIDRLTPFRADEVLVAVAFPPPAASGKRLAYVAAVPRAVAALAIGEAAAAGMTPLAIGVEGAAAAAMDFDFMPAARAAGIAPPRRDATWLWAAVGVLALINLGIAIELDSAATDRLAGQVEAQRILLSPVIAARSRVQAEDKARRGLIARRVHAEPLHVLDAVTRALPDGAWVERYAWDGRTLRLSGARQDGVDVVADLRRVPGFAHVRDLATDAPLSSAAGQRFDVAVDLGAAR
ncbi:PilN domain-containing protein [Glacieibacterium megasporae]|uniref:PilN domain-containing protein n=1 Tax=Glacieibacterium megasporae TaxID=2835787 RepID=UPI001C1E8A23|nr:PilN domain-containing protein [Polymorphobacter megasporae]UAJ09059.1 PilN domain-containing protein [Polymorphobacter megasporae]